MAVVIPDGIAGQTTEVSAHYSKVLLIIDHNSAVDALVQRDRARGIIKGGPAGQCLFKYVLRKHDVVVDDVVVYVGARRRLPKRAFSGVCFGRHSNPSPESFTEVTVEPPMLILKNSKRFWLC